MTTMKPKWVLAAALVLAAGGRPAAAQGVASPYLPRPAVAVEPVAAPPDALPDVPSGPPTLVKPRTLDGAGAAAPDLAAPPAPVCAPPVRRLGGCERWLYRLQDCFLGYPEEFRS